MDRIYLTKDLVEQMEEYVNDNLDNKLCISLDLGKTTVCLSRDEVFDILNRIPNKLRGDGVYVLEGDNLFKLEGYDGEHYYKLAYDPARYNDLPILQIDGIRMHRVKSMKVRVFIKNIRKRIKPKREDVVLDTCCGLGYYSIEFAKYVKQVITFEKHKIVLDLARYNPWSGELFERDNIRIVNDDVLDGIKGIPSHSVSVILHDPPTFKLTPELYSERLYEEFTRVAQVRETRLYHYIGDYEKNRKLYRRVIKMLENLGWKVKVDTKLLGLFGKY